MAISTAERKKRVSDLKEAHEDYFQAEGKVNALYIPKMAYRPSGKDELHVSFFPSELEKEEDVYTEFVSIDYVSEDPKRSLYLLHYNPHWKSEYELITSNSGFQRHMIPVSELKVVNDVVAAPVKPKFSTASVKSTTSSIDIFNIADPEATGDTLLIDKLEEINQTLITLTKVINKFNK
jgi:hypothetical protein|tara:strand:+ start:413 stop:949 length:537 start_codon:yes stop_codon:yes gene_type:complete